MFKKLRRKRFKGVSTSSLQESVDYYGENPKHHSVCREIVCSKCPFDNNGISCGNPYQEVIILKAIKKEIKRRSK